MFFLLLEMTFSRTRGLRRNWFLRPRGNRIAPDQLCGIIRTIDDCLPLGPPTRLVQHRFVFQLSNMTTSVHHAEKADIALSLYEKLVLEFR
jgi:hypothetical protein